MQKRSQCMRERKSPLTCIQVLRCAAMREEGEGIGAHVQLQGSLWFSPFSTVVACCQSPACLSLPPSRLKPCATSSTTPQYRYRMSVSSAARTGLFQAFKRSRFHVGPRTLKSQGVSIEGVQPVYDCGKLAWWARWTYFLVAADLVVTCVLCSSFPPPVLI